MVDEFVIIEARSTFTGQSKAAGFELRKAEFAPWLEKVRHVVIDDFPHFVDSPWARDFWQRDMAIGAINGSWAPHDIVLLTDADEIVRRTAVEDFEDGVLALKMRTFRYFLNYAATPESKKADGHTGAICTARHLGDYGSSYTRFVQSRPDRVFNAISQAGWHFTSLGDAERISEKFAAYAHREHSALRSKFRVEQALSTIGSGAYEAGWAPIAIDETFPDYIRANQQSLSELLIHVDR